MRRDCLEISSTHPAILPGYDLNCSNDSKAAVRWDGVMLGVRPEEMAMAVRRDWIWGSFMMMFIVLFNADEEVQLFGLWI